MDKNGWMSCKLDGLPKENGYYMITYISCGKRWKEKDVGFSKNLYEVNNYDFCNKKGISGFYGYDSEFGYFEYPNTVVAWMPSVKIDAYEGE